MWVLFAFGSALFAGLTAVLAKIGVRDVDSNLATALRTVVVLAFSWLMVLIAGAWQPLSSIEGRALLFLALSGLATGASWLCYFRALQLGEVNRVAAVDKSSTVLTMLLAFILLGEPLSSNMVLGMILILGGTYLMIERQSGEDATPKNKSWLFWAVLSAIFASLTAILGKVGIADVESNLGTAVRTGVVLVMAWVVVLVSRKPGMTFAVPSGELGFICLSGVATGASWLCYYRALQLGPASLVAPVDKLSILVTILFSRLVFHERLTRRAFLGLVLVTAGTLLLLF